MTVEMKGNMNKTKWHSKVIHLAVALALVLSLVLVMTPLARVGAATHNEEFSESDTFIVPETVTEITVEMWGGGGAGGGSTSAGGGSARGGAGGGGGAYADSTLTVEPGQELQVVVGTGGAGVSGANGTAGGPSFVGPDTNPANAFIRAAGGSGGTGNTAGGDPVGGAGGRVEDSIGQIRIAGANGEDGATAKHCRSGAGGEGAYVGGSGGAAVTSGNEDGNPGSAPGGGGGGARTQGNSMPRIGGAGAAGNVVITWVTSDLTVSSTEGGLVATPGEGVFTYDEGTVVDLVAEAEEGYRFVEWTGNAGSIADVYAATTNITMDGDYSITAEFVRQFDLTTSSTAGGSVTTPGEGLFTYDDGTVVDLVAEAEEGYQFVEWTGDVGSITDVYATTTTITVNGDYSITANFEEILPSPVYPTVTTKAATNISAYSSTLTMDYTVGDFSPVQVRFAYKKSAGLFWSYTDWVPKSEDDTHVESVTGLDSDTEYDFKAQLKSNDSEIEVEGTTLQFTTDTPSTPSPAGGCFIATAAYGTPAAEQIDVLREFRDIVLLESTVGSQFVALYYQFSPPVADFISERSFLRILVRELLVDPIVWIVEATVDIWHN